MVLSVTRIAIAIILLAKFAKWNQRSQLFESMIQVVPAYMIPVSKMYVFQIPNKSMVGQKKISFLY